MVHTNTRKEASATIQSKYKFLLKWNTNVVHEKQTEMESTAYSVKRNEKLNPVFHILQYPTCNNKIMK